MSSSVRFGLLNGGLAILWTMMMYVTGLNRTDTGQIINYIAIVIPLICMYYTIKEFRLHQGHGFISFGQAFRQAFTVGIIGGVIGVLFMMLYMKVIDTGYMEWLMQKQELKMADMGMSQEEIDKAMERSSTMMSPVWYSGWGLVGALFMSAVFSTIMAGVLKKVNPEEIA